MTDALLMVAESQQKGTNLCRELQLKILKLLELNKSHQSLVCKSKIKSQLKKQKRK